ncbi:MAG: hypothetical protein HGB08_02090 [Candidatus Moranbacteria bacterium]|nr:hypothetical protein [Candidatus Moranbacteria bacterium]
MGTMRQFLKEYTRHILAVIVLVLAFSISQGLFTTQTIKTEDCTSGKCAKVADVPNLSDENPFYYVDDILKDRNAGYYRLTYQLKTDKETHVAVKMATYSEKDQGLQDFDLAPSGEYRNKEILFQVDGTYPNVVFEKNDPKDGAGVFIKSVKLSQLGISSDAEFAALLPTVFGNVDTTLVDQSETKDSSYEFPWLKSPKTVIGQVFKADSDYLSGVSLKMNIVKGLDPGSREYSLFLKEADYDGVNVDDISSAIAEVRFSVGSDLDKYRQDDGSFRFPLYGPIEKGKLYMIGIDNSKVDVSDSNHLVLLGSKKESAYSDGSAFMKQGKNFYKIDGDLFFATYGAGFEEYDGQKLLSGASIEDSGKRKGMYAYATSGTFMDMADLDSSKGASFDSSKKIIIGSSKPGSEYVYRFHAGHPIFAISFQAEQARAGWNSVKAYYSFDNLNWQEIPSAEVAGIGDQSDTDVSSEDDSSQEPDSSDQSAGDSQADDTDNSVSDTASGTAGAQLQEFDFASQVSTSSKDVYLKIAYDPDSPQKSKYFGLKNLKFTAGFNRK